MKKISFISVFFLIFPNMVIATDPVMRDKEGYYIVKLKNPDQEIKIRSVYENECKYWDKFHFTVSTSGTKVGQDRFVYEKRSAYFSALPKNKMLWHIIDNNPHRVKNPDTLIIPRTTNLAFEVLNGKKEFPDMPIFECDIFGNILQAKFAYVSTNKVVENRTISNGRKNKKNDVFLYNVFVYGQKYPKESDIVNMGSPKRVSDHKFVSFFINGQQITNYFYLNDGWYDDLYVFEYKYDDDKKQYYFYFKQEYDDDFGILPSDYAFMYGNNVEEMDNSFGGKKFIIKIYDKIIQPDGTVSP